jgi:hypothetical protein
MASRTFRWSSLSPVLALGIALGATGCDDPVSPEAVADTYVLFATGGADFPVAVLDNEVVTVSILADTFRLRDDGTGSHTRSQRVAQHGPQPVVETHTWTSEFTYQMRGDGFEISYECPGFASPAFPTSCIPPPHEIGRWVSGGFVLESVPSAFVYLRVSGLQTMSGSSG